MTLYERIYRIYFRLCRNWMGNPNTFNTMLFKASSVSTQLYFNYVYKHILKTSKVRVEGRNFKGNVIASLTTYPARINAVGFAIETIFNQTRKPDRIILWLAKVQFPEGVESLPKMIKQQMDRGLEVRFVDDYKSHKKYYFAIKENPDCNVITFDDDVFYPPFIIEDLMQLNERFPNCVCAHSASEIPEESFYDMRKWQVGHFNSLNEKYGRLRLIGISGVLYPPHVLHQDVFNVELRQRLCPWADDLWLTMMAYINGNRIVRYEHCPNPLDIWGSQTFSLSRGGDMGTEVTQGLTNEEQWDMLVNHYKDILSKYIPN